MLAMREEVGMIIGRGERGRVEPCPCDYCAPRRKELEQGPRGPGLFLGIENMGRLDKYYKPGFAEWPGDKKIRRVR